MRCCPAQRRLVVRFDDDFAVDFDTLVALTGGGAADMTPLELRAQRIRRILLARRPAGRQPVDDTAGAAAALGAVRAAAQMPGSWW